jgi:predicted enzyme related to lactoylglutathione lyase
MVDTGGGEGAVAGGIGPSQGPGDEGVKVYVRVDDLQRHLERANRLGGTTVLEPMELPGGYGTIAIVLGDPDGNALGLWV